MPELVANCPRCTARQHSFDVKAFQHLYTTYGWKQTHECYCICKHCLEGTIFLVSTKDYDNRGYSEVDFLNYRLSLNNILEISGYINIRNLAIKQPPEHIPKDIKNIFLEGSESFSGNCPNAAAAMFRLCVDLATKNLLPSTETAVEGLNQDVRKNLSKRLKWLFEKEILTKSLESLSECIRQDGNDGAHDGTITQADAEDLLDFTYLLLERIYTEPARVEIANKRRVDRRNTPKEA